MKNFRLSVCIFALIVLLPGCWNGSKEARFSGLHVINVLDKELYDDCHIVGSENVLLQDVEKFAQKLAKDSEIVVYCSNFMCTASGMVVKHLKTLGFTQVYAYEAGMAEWYQSKLPVEGPCKESYLNKVIPPSEEEDPEVEVIDTQELYLKMKEAGLLN